MFVVISQIMSPIAPFFSEWLYGRIDIVLMEIKRSNRFTLSVFPQVDGDALQPALEHRMYMARTVSSVVLALRNKSSINVRQPLSRILIVTSDHVA